jgi:protein-S-isoprenylcysteine O-methyltransferase Ste14
MNRTVIRLIGAAIAAGLALAVISMGEIYRIAVGSTVGLISFVLLMISRLQLGKSFSVMPQARELVATGLYSRIQHPMYVFLDLVFVSLIVAFDWPILLFAWGVVVIVQTLQSRQEERILAASFGADYEAYRSRTWF